LADKSEAAQIGTPLRVLAEVIASDLSLLVTFKHATERFFNPKARGNPKALAQLDSYKRPLVGFLSANLQRFGIRESQRCLPGAERLSLIRLIRIFSLCRIRG